jgi:hypothetical protein
MNNKTKRSDRDETILLSLWKALVSNGVAPNMRAVYVEWDDRSLCLHFIIDGAFTEVEVEEMQCMGTEVVSDLPDSLWRTMCI